ncbi:major facilitator superfamily domain-containing protein [Xylaria cf. heliscus]|nr:major facilitator superfamily domain-containing protein [Xylaria cf. heliscus]
MGSRTTQSRNEPSAETTPLLGPPDVNKVSPNNVASHRTLAGPSRNAGAGPGNVENGSRCGDAAIANGASGDSPKPTVNLAILIPALSIGTFLVGLDNTLTVTTYGKIGSDLQALSSISWIATSFFLALTTFQPLYGKLSDIFSCKSCLLFAYTMFGLGCLGCGLARSVVELCIARAIAGAGGGGMNSLASILITDFVSLRDRALWQGYFGVMFTAGMSAGAPLGGFFVDSIGWRWAFIIQCPIALLAFVSVYLVLNLPRTDHSHWSAKVLRIDFIGAFLLVSAVFLLLFGLDNGSNKGWSNKITIVPLVLTPVLFAIFVLFEAKVAKEPFAPGHIIFNPPLLTAYGANFFGFAGQMGILFFIALFFQGALGMSASFLGLAFLPSTLSLLLGALGGGLIVKRTGRFYWITLTGYCLSLLSIVPMVLGVGQESAIITIIGLSILTFGHNISISTTLVAILANTAPEDAAVAIACNYLFRSLGTTIGISISTAMLQQMLRVNLARKLGGAERAREIEEKVRQSLDYIQRLDPDVANVVQKCYAIATQWAFVPVASFAVLAVALSLFLKEKKLDR